LAGILALCAILFLTAASSTGVSAKSETDGSVPSAKAGPRTFLALGLLFLLYVGTESSIGGWIAGFVKCIWPVDQFSPPSPSSFWPVSLAGRLAAPVVLRRIEETKVALFGLSLASVGTIVLLWAHDVGVVIAGTCLAGLGLAAVYPITIAHLSRLGAQGTR